jgi:hypothetical protein
MGTCVSFEYYYCQKTKTRLIAEFHFFTAGFPNHPRDWAGKARQRKINSPRALGVACDDRRFLRGCDIIMVNIRGCDIINKQNLLTNCSLQ